MQNCRQLVILSKKLIDPREITQSRSCCNLGILSALHCRRFTDQARDFSLVEQLTGCAFTNRLQQIDALFRRWWRTNDMQPMRNERVFEFQDRVTELRDLALGGVAPMRLRRAKLDDRGLRLNHLCEVAIRRTLLRRQLAPMIERRIEIEQASIEPGDCDGWRQIADEGRG